MADTVLIVDDDLAVWCHVEVFVGRVVIEVVDLLLFVWLWGCWLWLGFLWSVSLGCSISLAGGLLYPVLFVFLVFFVFVIGVARAAGREGCGCYCNCHCERHGACQVGRDGFGCFHCFSLVFLCWLIDKVYLISASYRFFYIALKFSALYKNFQIELKFSASYRFFEIALKNRPRFLSWQRERLLG